ncbi:flagellar hook-length control protein FliK [Planctomicrobium sp. SH527]|uniref:flagellar hook-length control protein FliK n=1 Tax=Planctomicrobium sp. SH527 TaxID=3448123 RepID=UPI003F5C5CC9
MRLPFHLSTHQAGNETLSLLNLTLNQGDAALAGLESFFAPQNINGTGLWPVGDAQPDHWQTDFSQLLSQLQQQSATPQATSATASSSAASIAIENPVTTPISSSVASAIHGSVTRQIALSLDTIADRTATQFPLPDQLRTPTLPAVHEQSFIEENTGASLLSGTETAPPEPASFVLDRLLLTQSIPLQVRSTLTPSLNQNGLNAVAVVSSVSSEIQPTANSQVVDLAPELDAGTTDQSDEIPDEVLAQVLNAFPQQIPVPSQLRDLEQFNNATQDEHVDPAAHPAVHAQPVSEPDSLLRQTPFEFTANPSQTANLTRPETHSSSQTVPRTASSEEPHGVRTLQTVDHTEDPRTLAGELPPTSPQPQPLPDNRSQSQSTAPITTKIETTFNQTRNAPTAAAEITGNQHQTQQHSPEPVTTVPTQPTHFERASGQLSSEHQVSTGEPDRQLPSPAAQSTLQAPLTENVTANRTVVESQIANEQDRLSPEPEQQPAQTTQESVTEHLPTRQTKTTDHHESPTSEWAAQSSLSSAVVLQTPVTASEPNVNPVVTQPTLTSTTSDLGGGSPEFQSSTDDRNSSAQSDRVTPRTDGAVETMAQIAAPVEQTFGNQLQSATLSNLQPSLTEQITQQLVQQINLTDAEGVQKFQMRLDPEELGGMVIEIHRNEKGELQIQVSADSPETRAMVENQTKQISSSLQNQGVALTEFNVLQHGTESFGDSQHQQRHRAEVDENGHETTGQTAAKAASSVTESPSGEISFRA